MILKNQNCDFDYCAKGFKLPNNSESLDCVKDCGYDKIDRNGSCIEKCDPLNDKKINSFLLPAGECIQKTCKNY